jgi:acyl-CoA reductase-like NAD-dependent aldehyde dehydrogenase
MVSTAMKRSFGYFVGNEFRETANTLPVRNPYSGEEIATVARPGVAEIVGTFRAAAEAFQTTRNLPTYKLAAILGGISKGIEQRAEELARTLAQEAAKPIRDARGEVSRAVSTFALAAGEVVRWGGEILPLDVTPAGGDRLALVRRFPIGVVLGISPFNFPLNLVAHKVAPALAARNAVVLKPASATPLSTLLLAEIYRDAGGIPGALGVLPAAAKDIEPFIANGKGFAALSFTGSAEIGWRLKAMLPRQKVTLELGGNAGAIIEPDADLDWAVTRTVKGGYAYAGQICISVQRIFVHQQVYQQVKGELIKRVGKLKLGDPLDEAADLSAMIDVASAEQAETRVKDALERGATLLCGGERTENRFSPTLLENVPADAPASCEELFAPVCTLEAYQDLDEAIEKVNASRFGLQAGIFTADMGKALQAFNRLEVGGVVVNDVPTFRVDNYPYGGIKDSGYGREGVRFAMEELSDLKTLVLPNPK